MDSADIDTERILTQLTLEEKISLLAAVDWWRTPVINRDGLFVPHIKVRFPVWVSQDSFD